MADSTNSPTSFRNERSNSTSSTGSTTSGRRGSGVLFENLRALKRKDDPASLARRQSLSEQRPQAGFIGTMWNNWVRGPVSPSK